MLIDSKVKNGGPAKQDRVESLDPSRTADFSSLTKPNLKNIILGGEFTREASVQPLTKEGFTKNHGAKAQIGETTFSLEFLAA